MSSLGSSPTTAKMEVETLPINRKRKPELNHQHPKKEKTEDNSYFCILHDNDRTICGIYECSGVRYTHSTCMYD
jgi:hypothetical protein